MIKKMIIGCFIWLVMCCSIVSAQQPTFIWRNKALNLNTCTMYAKYNIVVAMQNLSVKRADANTANGIAIREGHGDIILKIKTDPNHPLHSLYIADGNAGMTAGADKILGDTYQAEGTAKISLAEHCLSDHFNSTAHYTYTFNPYGYNYVKTWRCPAGSEAACIQYMEDNWFAGILKLGSENWNDSFGIVNAAHIYWTLSASAMYYYGRGIADCEREELFWTQVESYILNELELTHPI